MGRLMWWFVSLARYGEKNPYFSVASFSNGEEDEDKAVTRKVASALERVTSDYHSGSSSSSSSSEEDCALWETPGSSPLTVAPGNATHQVKATVVVYRNIYTLVRLFRQCFYPTWLSKNKINNGLLKIAAVEGWLTKKRF